MWGGKDPNQRILMGSPGIPRGQGTNSNLFHVVRERSPVST